MSTRLKKQVSLNSLCENFAEVERFELQKPHTFRLSPAKFFPYDMRSRVVKRIEQNENISFTLFSFEVHIFQLLQNFLTAKPIRLLFSVTWTFNEDKKIFTKWPSHSFVRPKEKIDLSIFSKQELTSFRLVVT